MGALMTPLFLAACALLVLAGVPKVLDPKPLVRAVRTAGLPLPPAAVRAFAAAEVVVGLAGLVRPGVLTGLLAAVLYALFSGFVGLALARGGVLDSCGCFGKADTPPTRSHLLVTVLLALAGLAVAVDAPASAWWLHAAGEVLATVALAALLGLLAWAVMAVAPTVTARAVRSADTAEPGGRSGGPATRGNRGRTFAIRTPAPLPDPTFPPHPQKG